MKTGDRLILVRDVDPPTGPYSTPNSVMVAALTAMGVELDEHFPPTETREKVPDGKGGYRTKRTVTFTLRPKSSCGRFKTATLIGWWKDPAWHAANPEHPLAYLKQGFENFSRIGDFVHSIVPCAIHRKGRRIAVIPLDASPERRQALLDGLNR